MSLFSFLDKQVQKFRWFDVTFVKIATFATALLVAKFFPSLLSYDWGVYILVFVFASLRPFYVLFKK